MWMDRIFSYLRKVDEVGMKEINFPVLVLNDDCLTCDELDIVSDTGTRMYLGDHCVNQCMRVRCSNVYKCMKIQERLEQLADRERVDRR